MADNAYEEARKQRLEDNKKRFEDLGILNITKSLSEDINGEKKSTRNRSRPRSTMNLDIEPRRSSRPRSQTVLYHEEADIELPTFRKRSKTSSSTSYIARPLDEVKVATRNQRANALMQAENLQSQLKSGHPCCIKSMVRSHVYSCFWLGLPSSFCKVHLPLKELDMVLENENGDKYGARYIGSRSGLSGGWRAFAWDHKLDDGDAVVLELTEPTKFKVYIIRHDRTTEIDVEEINKRREQRLSNTRRGRVLENDCDDVEKSAAISESMVLQERGRVLENNSDDVEKSAAITESVVLKETLDSTKTTTRSTTRGRKLKNPLQISGKEESPKLEPDLTKMEETSLELPREDKCAKKVEFKTKRGRNPKKLLEDQVKEEKLQPEREVEMTKITEEDELDAKILLGAVETTVITNEETTKNKGKPAPPKLQVEKDSRKLFRRKRPSMKLFRRRV